MKTIEQLFDFIEESPTAYHACAALASRLQKAGADRLSEGQTYHLESGKIYYVQRNGSSLIAFRMPKEKPCGFQIMASHSDSPTFKLKDIYEKQVDGHYTLLNVEKYGGMLMAPWFDRPLSVAGRVLLEEDGRLVSRLVNLDEDLLMLPSLAIHMNRDVNEGYKYNAQQDMMPLLGDETSAGAISRRISELTGKAAKQILGADLFLYNRQRGCVWGANQEYLSAPRLDDLECAFGSMAGFLEAEESQNIAVCAVFDNEETGSLSKQGASSTFLRDTLTRIGESLGWGYEEYCIALQNSFMISADNAHAVHPNHPEKADAQNRPYMNGGIVVKYHAGQKYTTDAVSAALLKSFCNKAGVSLQTYANRSDMAGGSTLGNLSNAQVSLNTVDIGLPQLAMHSPYETAGARDLEDLIRLSGRFFEGAVRAADNGSYQVV